jgi:hypothetical protein
VSSDDEKLYRRREMRSREQSLEVLFGVGMRDVRADELLSGIEFPRKFVQDLRAPRKARDHVTGLLHLSDGRKPLGA